MGRTVTSICCICVAAALCEQMMDGSRYIPAVRLAVGMEIAAAAVSGLLKLWEMLNG